MLRSWNAFPDLKNYILDNDEDYLFSAITASYKTPPVFEPMSNGNGNGGESNIGVLKLKLGDELIINDGQHRCAGIASALKENPELGDHTLAVLLFNYENKERVQQMFSDLNRFVVKTSKSLDIVYDKRDKISAATIAFLDQVPLFEKLTEKDDATLKSKSPKLFTLAALYDANRELLKGHENADVIGNATLLKTYWTEVVKHMPDWNSVFTEHKRATERRKDCLSLDRAARTGRARRRASEGRELARAPGGAGHYRLVQAEQGSSRRRCQPRGFVRTLSSPASQTLTSATIARNRAGVPSAP